MLIKELEKCLGKWEMWDFFILCSLFDMFVFGCKCCCCLEFYEKNWLCLAGFCLCFGFGDVIDGWWIE